MDFYSRIKLTLLFIFISIFSFSQDTPSVPGKSTTTTTDPVGNVTTEVFFGPYSFERKVFKGSSTLLSTTDFCYNGSAFPCAPTTVAVPVTQKDIFTTVTNISGPSRTNIVYNTYGLVTDSKAYNFGPSLVNEGVTIYSSLSNTSIKNRPSSITTKDSGGTIIAQNTYTYNGSGNVLTRSSLVGGSTFLTDSFTYTSKGMIATSKGANGAVVTYNNALCGGIRSSSVIFPIGTQTYTWDCNGDVPTSVTDINGKKFSSTYTDPFWRLTSNVNPLSTTTTYVYTPITQESITSFSNSTNDKLVTLNSAGRTIISQIRQAKGSAQYDTTSQAYDVMGRRTSASVPCVKSVSSSCITAINVSYDTGSVPTTTVTDSLNGSVSTSYSAQDKTTLLSPAPTGEKIKGNQLEYDGLGRLTSICEISSGIGSGSCGQRIAQTGYVTTYTYDAIGNITTITQGSQTRSRTYDDLGRVLTSTEPETGTTTYTYDTTAGCGGITSKGDLVSKVDANGNTTCYKYDAQSRLTSVTYSGPNSTDSAFYVYDAATVNGIAVLNAKGRLAEAYTCTVCPGTKKTDIGFSYNSIGQITDAYESTTSSGGYYHVALTLYPNDSINTLQLTPSVFPVITYSLDGEGRVSSVQAGSSSLITNTVRGADDQILSITYGTTDTDTYGYDSLLKTTQYGFSSKGNSVIGTLFYNANGTVKSKTVSDPFKAANNETCTYSHDDLLRLSSSNCGTINQSFSYDRYGNITKTGSFSFSPTYSSTTNRMTAIGVVTPTYDANGNILTDGTSTYTWDAEGRILSGPGVNSIIYNALGLMAEETTGSSHQQIVYLPNGEKLALMNGQSLVLARVPLVGGAQAIYTSAGLAYYAHADGLGSVRITTLPDRSVSSDLAYAPFGEPYNNTGVPTSVLSFTGLNQDTITGLYDTSTRKYNPLQSRWISADKNENPNLNDPQTFNLYSYVVNRPLGSTDRTGAQTDDGSDLPYASPEVITQCLSDLFCSGGGGLGAEGYAIYNAEPIISSMGQTVLSNSIFSEMDINGAVESVMSTMDPIGPTTGYGNSLGMSREFIARARPIIGAGFAAGELPPHWNPNSIEELIEGINEVNEFTSGSGPERPALIEHVVLYHGSVDNFDNIMAIDPETGLHSGLEATAKRRGSGISYAYVTRDVRAAEEAMNVKDRPEFKKGNNGLIRSDVPKWLYHGYFEESERVYPGFFAGGTGGRYKGKILGWTEIPLINNYQVTIFNEHITAGWRGWKSKWWYKNNFPSNY